MPDVRKGQYTGKLSREAFRIHFLRSFYDPNFSGEREAIDRLETIAWNNYETSRKSPITRKAGFGFADPDYDLSVEWIATRDAIAAAEARQKDPASPSKVLVICASPRNDGTCPGEMAKSYRFATQARSILEAAAIEVDLLDLSLLTSEYGKKIHPCKACVSTAMPLCHWPCSCYPNHSLGQADDWMGEIYPKWVGAHGIIIITPVHWYQSPSVLKLMIDRLVCADGGNPDPSSTAGKDAAKAKEIELRGWSYPEHLAGRAYGLIIHGDAAAPERVAHDLTDWLDAMGLVAAGTRARLDRFIGYYEPYATSHQTLDADKAMMEEAGNVAKAVAQAVIDLRAGKLRQSDDGLSDPRKK